MDLENTGLQVQEESQLHGNDSSEVVETELIQALKNKDINERCKIERAIRTITQSIDPRFDVVFTPLEAIVSYYNKKNGRDYTKTFDEIILKLLMRGSIVWKNTNYFKILCRKIIGYKGNINEWR